MDHQLQLGRAIQNMFKQESVKSFFSQNIQNIYQQEDHFNSPLFPDINGDNAVEYFYNNHQGFYPGRDGVCPYLVYKDCTSMVYGKFLENGKLRPLFVDFTLNDKRFKSYHNYDSHGGAILDIDGDGFLDLYLNAGGGMGLGRGMAYASSLYWGSPNVKKHAEWTIEGGSETALITRLENFNGTGRGRSVYFADFNKDGRLDILLINEQRNDDLLAPSQLLYNMGNRRFMKDRSFKEYIRVAIFSNLRKRKHKSARYLIIQRARCSPKGPNHAKFCKTHAYQSWAMYYYSFDYKKMKLMYDTITPIKDVDPCKNIEVADVNEDGMMDFFLSTQKKIQFFYSSKTSSNIISLKGVSEEILPPSNYKLGIATMQDFNLDGILDILAVYSSKIGRKNMTIIYSRKQHASKPPFWEVYKKKDRFPIFHEKNPSNFLDIAAVDYNNDGFKDIVITKKNALYHLTSTPKYRPKYLAVVLRGKGHVNRYGIGASIRLKVYNKERKKFVYYLKSVTSYSHGTTSHGGAVDHRIVFGLGYSSVPMSLSVVWPNNVETNIGRKLLFSKMNSMVEPLILNSALKFNYLQHPPKLPTSSTAPTISLSPLLS